MVSMFLTRRGEAGRVMIAQVLADPRQRVPDGNAELLQQGGRADAGELQKLRRVIGAARQDDLARGPHRHAFAAAPADVVGDADGALVLQQQLRWRARACAP